MDKFTENDNLILDQIISTRRSTRAFSDRMPERSDIEDVIDSGMKAPFASVSADDVDIFRHFFPLPKGHKARTEIDELIKSQSLIDLDALVKETETNAFLMEHSERLKGLWSMVGNKGIPAFLDIPYFIVVAEWAGARRAEKQSLAHVMENMWLKATALNLGFCLVSPIESMSDNEAFCSLFNLPAGRYGFHGCLIGYPKSDHASSHKVNGKVTWL